MIGSWRQSLSSDVANGPPCPVSIETRTEGLFVKSERCLWSCRKSSTAFTTAAAAATTTFTCGINAQRAIGRAESHERCEERDGPDSSEPALINNSVNDDADAKKGADAPVDSSKILLHELRVVTVELGESVGDRAGACGPAAFAGNAVPRHAGEQHSEPAPSRGP